jgi:hypothetical protein
MYWDNLNCIKNIYIILYVSIQLHIEQWTSLCACSKQFDMYLHTSCTPMIILSFMLEVSRVNMLKYCQAVYRFSLTHRFVCPLKLVYVLNWKKIRTVNGIATLIIAKMGGYVKFCTFFKNPLHCQIPGLSVELQCLYGLLSTCNCYLDISQECI